MDNGDPFFLYISCKFYNDELLGVDTFRILYILSSLKYMIENKSWHICVLKYNVKVYKIRYLYKTLALPSSGGVWLVSKPHGIDSVLLFVPLLPSDPCWCSSEKSIGWAGNGTIPGSEKTALECDINNNNTITLYATKFPGKKMVCSL